jgi:hypothetical protein
MRYLMTALLMLLVAGAGRAQNATCTDQQGNSFPCTIEKPRTEVPFIPQTAISQQILAAQAAANAAPAQGQSVYAQRRDACKAAGSNYKWHPWKGLHGSCELKKK